MEGRGWVGLCACRVALCRTHSHARVAEKPAPSPTTARAAGSREGGVVGLSRRPTKAETDGGAIVERKATISARALREARKEAMRPETVEAREGVSLVKAVSEARSASVPVIVAGIAPMWRRERMRRRVRQHLRWDWDPHGIHMG